MSMHGTPPVKISNSDLKDRPNAVKIVKVVRGRQHVICCRQKQKRFGRRLLCPICGTYVEAVYLPDEKKKFACRECYRKELRSYFAGPFPKRYPGLWRKMKRQWGDKQY